jgi:hypothetical protein
MIALHIANSVAARTPTMFPIEHFAGESVLFGCRVDDSARYGTTCESPATWRQSAWDAIALFI